MMQTLPLALALLPTWALGTLDYSREHIVDVHHWMHDAPPNILFRSNMPVNSSGGFDLALLLDGVKKRADALQLQLGWPPYVMDVSLNNEFDIKDGFGKEQAFWRKPSSAQHGNFTNWPLGTAGVAPPSLYSEAKRRELLNTTMWEVDKLPQRVDLLHDMLVTTQVPGRSVVFVVHCSAGCDRTGEVIGAYRLKYGGMNLDGTSGLPHNVTSMYALNTAECGRSPNYWSTTALEWYCYDLLYREGVASGNCTGFASCKFAGDCKPTADASTALGLPAAGAAPATSSAAPSALRAPAMAAAADAPGEAIADAASTPPHLIFMLADDFGHYDIQYNNPLAPTPYLHSLAKEGIILQRHYVYQFCSPTRSSLMSGRLPIHVNTANNPTTKPGGVDLRMQTLPEALKTANYSCHTAGKW